MANALVLTPWVSTTDPDTGADSRTVLLQEMAQPGRLAWTDVTGQAAPRIMQALNVCAVWVTCDDTMLAAIDADPRFRVLYDSGSRLASRTLNNPQFNAIRNFLINRLGFTSAQVDAAIGTSHGGRTVAQIVDALIAYIRTL